MRRGYFHSSKEIGMLEIYDLYAAAYAGATGVPLVKVSLESSWGSFVFDDSTGQASRALGEWRNGSGLVLARAYAQALKGLKRGMRNMPAQGTQGDSNGYRSTVAG